MKRIIALIIILLMLFLAACSKDENNNTLSSKGISSLDGLKITIEEKVNMNNRDASCIFVVTNTNGNDDGFDTMLGMMEEKGHGFYKTMQNTNGLINVDDVVILKFNCQWSERGGTNTDLIRSVVDAITRHPDGFTGEIIIADNGQAQYGSLGRGGSVEWSKNNAVDISQSPESIAKVYSEKFKVSALTWDGITSKRVEDYSKGDYEDGFILGEQIKSTGITISYPKFKTSYGTYVNFKEGIWDRKKENYDRDKLKIINMPVLKSHMIYCVTASIKNYMGTTSDRLTGHSAHNSVGLGGMGSQMAYTRMPVLNILDAIWINPRPYLGPSTSYGDALQTNIIAASKDPAALDYFAAKKILVKAAEEFHSEGISSMDPDSTAPGGFGYWLLKSMEEINKIGFKATVDEKNINVFVRESKE